MYRKYFLVLGLILAFPILSLAQGPPLVGDHLKMAKKATPPSPPSATSSIIYYDSSGNPRLLKSDSSDSAVLFGAFGGDVSGGVTSITVNTVGGASAANIADAVTKRHSQNTDTGTNQTTFIINSGGNQLIFSSTGLTGNRTFLFPDVAGSTVLTTGSSAGAFPTLNQSTSGNAATATLASDVTDNVSIQQIEVVKNSGAVVSTRKQLNFIEGTNITLTVSDDSGNGQTDITINSSGGGGGTTFDAIGDAAASGQIDNANYDQVITYNTLAGKTGLKISSNSTAAASNAQILFESALSGANSTSTQTTYAGKFTNTHTGTSSTNIAGYFSASGGTNNYGIIVEAGRVGIATTAPIGGLEVYGGGSNAWAYFTGNAGSNPASAFTQGLGVSWNRSGGEGETNLVYSSGVGGNPGLRIGSWNGSTYVDDQLIVKSSRIGINISSHNPEGVLDVTSAGSVADNWIYFYQNNIGGTNPKSGRTNGFSFGWNKSGGDGEANLIYGIGTGGNARMEIGYWNGSTYVGEAAFRQGKFGQGTVSPVSILHVRQINDSTDTTNPVGFFVDSVGAAGELTASSGNQRFAEIAPVVNQSGTASATVLRVNVTSTALGSGGLKLLDLAVAGSSRASVDNGGYMSLSGGLTFGSSGFVRFAGGHTFTGTYSGALILEQDPVSSGSPTGYLYLGGAHTGLDASTEAIDVHFSLDRTVEFNGGNFLATQRAFRISPPTYSATSSTTIKKAATFYIDGPPVAGTNVTLTASYALYAAGDSYVDGSLRITSDFTMSGAGSKLTLPAGADQIVSTATLVAGTVTVSNARVTASSIIIITGQNSSGTHGSLGVENIGSGTFDIVSTNAADTRTVGYLIIN